MKHAPSKLRTRAALAASTLVLAGSLAACGGDSSGSDAAPQAASEAEFCKAYNSLFDSFSGATSQPSDADTVKAIKTWASTMKDTGTPKDIPADARRGFETVLETVDKIKDGDSQADISKLTNGLDSSDQKDTEAFGNWATKTCPMQTPAVPSAPASSDAP